MARTVAIGIQDFEKLISNDCFYVDKTGLIKEWWDSNDEVTLITRPRRFGKTLNMNMLERFFSNKYEGQGDLFQNLAIWKEQKFRELQGKYPVLFLSFAGVKQKDFPAAKRAICQLIAEVYVQFEYVRKSDILTNQERRYWDNVCSDMDEVDASVAIRNMCNYLHRYYGRKTIILLDEYDTPLQEAYVSGYWEDLVAFTRALFNNTFKTNPFMERAVMTGITRVSKESMFSDLNNLKVITMTSDLYASYFGFTEAEVFAAMDEFCLTNKTEVKMWYDGFTIGNLSDIYNPWSIISFLDEGKLKTYWANTSSNGLVGSLIRAGNRKIKMKFEDLLQGSSIHSEIDEEMVFNQLDGSGESAVWSLLFASGYLKTVDIQGDIFELELTNYEVRKMFETMVNSWFNKSEDYNDFVQSLLNADLESMNEYMTQVAESMFSSFDGGEKPSAKTPERFYHGFVLGLLVELKGRYEVTSNRESGFGRYDVMLRPLKPEDDGIILEFKVYNPKKEGDLEDTVQAALRQIAEKKYEQVLLDQGIKKDSIRRYGFAFRGKEVLIG